MEPQLAGWRSTQHGLVLRHQALAAGMSVDEVRRRVRRGEWIAVRRGVYVGREHWDALDEHRGRPLLEARAASLTMRVPHMLSHDSAAHAWSLPILAGDRMVHVTRPDVRGGRTEFGVKHHRAGYRECDTDRVEGLPVLSRARTAIDIAREHGLRHGLVACDSALRAGVGRRALEDVLATMPSWPGLAAARRAVTLADPGAESVGESLTRLLVLELGLGPVETQFGLTDGRRTVFCDLRVQRHVIEFDGRVKYRGPEAGGFAGRPAEDVVWQEKQRQDFICGFKLGMSRVVWADLRPDVLARTRDRLRREILDTGARFGVSVHDLAPYRVTRR